MQRPRHHHQLRSAVEEAGRSDGAQDSDRHLRRMSFPQKQPIATLQGKREQNENDLGIWKTFSRFSKM